MRTLLLFITCLIATTAGAQTARPKDLGDSALLDLTERQTFRYFWDFAHPVSGMARERSNHTFNTGEEVVTTGGTGFGRRIPIMGCFPTGWTGRRAGRSLSAGKTMAPTW
jgi:hypothetical protein